MIPTTTSRSVQVNGAVASGEFGISLEDSAHIMTILRDTLYSDKILAVLREYGSNAWDAHRDSGKADLPIEVTLPTHEDPTLSIRDFGHGLSRDGVFNVYTQYGRSTKRGSDASVGMLGIGSKSGFAYADSFTVTSFHGGVKSTYVAVLDSSDKGVVNLLHEEPCGEETGVLIQLAVEPSDIEGFHKRAKRIFKHFSPRPKINCELPQLPKSQSRLKAGTIYHDVGDWENGGWVAVMGCVSYRVDIEQVMGFELGLPTFVRELSGALFFRIGEVHINASREELKYTDSTKRAIVDKVNLLIEEYVRLAIDDLEGKNLTPWERRLSAQTLQKFKLVVPKKYQDLLSGWVSLNGKIPSSFWLYSGKSLAENISIAANSRILLRDDSRSLKGYSLASHDYVLRKDKNVEWDQVEDDLEKLLSEVGLTGIVVKKISELPWSQPIVSSGRRANVKHKLKVFRWNPKSSHFTTPYSAYWEPEEREPSDDDVYVEIESFQAIGLPSDMMSLFRSDEAMLSAFDRKMPSIYAYKVTVKDPSRERKGTHYADWRKSVLFELVQEKTFVDEYETWRWSVILDEHERYYGYYRDRGDAKKNDERLSEILGKDHVLVEFRRNIEDSKKRVKRGKISTEVFEDMIERMEREKRPLSTYQARKDLDKIYSTYPLFSISTITLSALRGEDQDKWVHYVQAIDKGAKP